MRDSSLHYNARQCDHRTRKAQDLPIRPIAVEYIPHQKSNGDTCDKAEYVTKGKEAFTRTFRNILFQKFHERGCDRFAEQLIERRSNQKIPVVIKQWKSQEWNIRKDPCKNDIAEDVLCPFGVDGIPVE